jgi:two-component system response regulator DevR
VILAPDAGESALLEAVIAGAAGYVVDDGTPEPIARAIERAARGESALADASVGSLLDWIRRHHADPPPPRGPLDMLTPRERQTLALVAEGRTNAEIGRALILSTHTVKTYLSVTLKKLGARNRAEAAAIWVRETAAERAAHGVA